MITLFSFNYNSVVLPLGCTNTGNNIVIPSRTLAVGG